MYRLLLFVIFLNSSLLFSQNGRLLLVGGGNEKNGQSSWSTPAYRWAVEVKKVAIISTSAGSLAPYLKQQCGAEIAKEFVIPSRDSADRQATYDSLMKYDVIFFRGGDQYDYYRYYKNTKLIDAVVQIFSNGGTICGTSAGMHILSEVVFTAKYGSAYSDETIENPNNNYVTLENDFLQLVPGYIFDTHFSERGRFGRLVGFLANYKLNNNTNVIGIGMDDLTCMTVDETGLGIVYGTGCANIYRSADIFSLNGTKLLTDSVFVTQLLHGCTYDFTTHTATFQTLDKPINTDLFEETGNYFVLASGSNNLNENVEMFDDFVTKTGLITDSILVLSENETQLYAVINLLNQAGATNLHSAIINSQAGLNTDLEQLILNSKKFLFLSNNIATFNTFLESSNGILLKQKIREKGMVSAFIGDDSRFAGKTVVANYYTEYASYYAELTFSPGLKLLNKSVIVPNTFYSSEMFENTASAIPYAMALDTLKYGIWLTNHNYMKYGPSEGKTIMTSQGEAPVMILTNIGHLTGFSTHTATGTTSYPPRMIAGFEQLNLSLIDNTNPFTMGNIGNTATEDLLISSELNLFPNPANGKINLRFSTNQFEWKILQDNGIIVLEGDGKNGFASADISGLPSGLYLAQFIDSKNGIRVTTKFLKN